MSPLCMREGHILSNLEWYLASVLLGYRVLTFDRHRRFGDDSDTLVCRDGVVPLSEFTLDCGVLAFASCHGW